MDIIEALYGKRQIGQEERRSGDPRTDEERRAQHAVRYGSTVLPPRGTGLGQASEPIGLGFWRRENPLVWVIVAGIGFGIYRLWQYEERSMKRAEEPIRIKERGNPLMPFEGQFGKTAELAAKKEKYSFNPRRRR